MLMAILTADVVEWTRAGMILQFTVEVVSLCLLCFRLARGGNLGGWLGKMD
jgi:hypothetical protein